MAESCASIENVLESIHYDRLLDSTRGASLAAQRAFLKKRQRPPDSTSVEDRYEMAKGWNGKIRRGRLCLRRGLMPSRHHRSR